MNLRFKIKDARTGEFTEDYALMMSTSGLDPKMGYENIGIQADGTAVIFDKCGGFGYLSEAFVLDKTITIGKMEMVKGLEW